jgi:hypothetical protein
LPARSIHVVLVATAVAGTLAFAAPAAFADPTAAPQAPTGLIVAPEDSALDLSWTPAVADPDNPVVQYDVTVAPTDGPADVAVSEETPDTQLEVTGLVNGVGYTVSVVAATDVPGVSSPPATATGRPRTVPGRPALGAIAPVDGGVRVHWTAPATDGGAPVTSYVVWHAQADVAKPVTVPAGARSVTLTGLTNGQPALVAVQAVNAAGKGAQSELGGPVVPRRLARLGTAAQVSSHVVFGAPTTVHADLVAPDGKSTSGQTVQLFGRASSGRWHRLLSGVTRANGTVTLATTLHRTMTLRLRHPTGAVTAADATLRTVHVADRVAAHASRTSVYAGHTVHVSGTIAPAQAPESLVKLQRRTGRHWHTVRTVAMRSANRYSLSWHPRHAGRYALRVLRPTSAANAAGTSHVWVQHVQAPSAAELAHEILANSRITLAKVHMSGVADNATAYDDIRDVAAGRLAQRSSYQNAPGGSTPIDMSVLRTIVALGRVARIDVAEIAGGSHAPDSDHYKGRAVDIDMVNGLAVGGGAPYGIVVRVCRANGASAIYDPGYDPVGGHNNHVHCGWS